ncbi:hypothetical protein [Argonema galeatum]|uniref:hypothetical protein n=1 Tax=Argonema galeatum TaxID=2942762 RepID=UPI00201188AA|nr:hypothetical protein [Argonema galeatum]MCL1465114.1 hypothetical protein [Argonema galeatum A003/A1]
MNYEETGEKVKRWNFFFLLFSFYFCLFPVTSAVAEKRERFSCPADVETLTTLMLRDLPSYANRVTQRARLRSRDRSLDVYGYFIVAGQAEFSPLTLGPGEYNPTTSQGEDNIQQVFFTTLQRRYSTTKAIQIQDYHWLFLTKTASGWRLAMMFSMTGPYPAGRPPTAPRDSSYGVIGQAIEIWLRDCYGGVVRSDMGDRTSVL